jgi:hypothetical protein
MSFFEIGGSLSELESPPGISAEELAFSVLFVDDWGCVQIADLGASVSVSGWFRNCAIARVSVVRGDARIHVVQAGGHAAVYKRGIAKFESILCTFAQGGYPTVYLEHRWAPMANSAPSKHCIPAKFVDDQYVLESNTSVRDDFVAFCRQLNRLVQHLRSARPRPVFDVIVAERYTSSTTRWLTFFSDEAMHAAIAIASEDEDGATVFTRIEVDGVSKHKTLLVLGTEISIDDLAADIVVPQSRIGTEGTEREFAPVLVRRIGRTTVPASHVVEFAQQWAARKVAYNAVSCNCRTLVDAICEYIEVWDGSLLTADLETQIRRAKIGWWS